jgi:hypothetical protein
MLYGGKPIAVWSESVSGVVNPLLAFYDIYGGIAGIIEVPFFCSVLDTTRDKLQMHIIDFVRTMIIFVRTRCGCKYLNQLKEKFYVSRSKA